MYLIVSIGLAVDTTFMSIGITVAPVGATFIPMDIKVVSTAKPIDINNSS
jgi:hypothetical protein